MIHHGVINILKEVIFIDYKIGIQILVSFVFFLFTLYVSLYEGSNLLLDTPEWKYTTKFTHLIYENPSLPEDITNIDLYLYAVKYYSFFPIMNLISGLYFFILLVYIGIKRNLRRMSYVLAITGSILIILSLLFFSSFSIGTIIYRIILFITGLIFLVSPMLLKYKK
ncbi:hypothetical protein JCM21714_2250 [Gracilibacillus boraciitolerans JCM 21714]|uniref:DUF4306 domain-containing protein n=1 Tax=Gracilibacillus boraciitolerans JCM 21714 TaxID=1298598 RepID=W4VJ63_9BACI|nr:hypothetical protein JCM21714_2250 [Gracilibacillus boraciitolerans JCM 21714]